MNEHLSLSSWIPIKEYREFYDVPRSFLIPSNEGSGYLYFDCPFDDQLDDYQNKYSVSEIPILSEDMLSGDWSKLSLLRFRCLGHISVNKVEFDASRRSAVKCNIYDLLSEA